MKIEKKSFWKSKMFLFAILPLFLIGTIFAVGYVVSTLTLTVGVAEPFTVQYAILGDGGNYNGNVNVDCPTATNWFTSNSQSIPTGNMLAGEGRGVCVKITNLAEGTVPYAITSTFANETCKEAFGNPQTITGTATANTHGGAGSLNYNGVLVKPLTGLAPVSGCVVTIEVSRV